mmetsp:Transcript_3312/g.13151  ORF Transcript_3312/g.13151 Transcript_3312/m.13151 type:complete len:275 (-) Transcript_3312:1022-1846(-)
MYTSIPSRAARAETQPGRRHRRPLRPLIRPRVVNLDSPHALLPVEPADGPHLVTLGAQRQQLPRLAQVRERSPPVHPRVHRLHRAEVLTPVVTARGDEHVPVLNRRQAQVPPRLAEGRHTPPLIRVGIVRLARAEVVRRGEPSDGVERPEAPDQPERAPPRRQRPAPFPPTRRGDAPGLSLRRTRSVHLHEVEVLRPVVPTRGEHVVTHGRRAEPDAGSRHRRDFSPLAGFVVESLARRERALTVAAPEREQDGARRPAAVRHGEVPALRSHLG